VLVRLDWAVLTPVARGAETDADADADAE